ncbi:hypothetical protein B566_EDAN015409 [Ephemera danica]|nr:hypothetical protein B566_EDAN015409 [Ephemera danica]
MEVSCYHQYWRSADPEKNMKWMSVRRTGSCPLYARQALRLTLSTLASPPLCNNTRVGCENCTKPRDTAKSRDMSDLPLPSITNNVHELITIDALFEPNVGDVELFDARLSHSRMFGEWLFEARLGAVLYYVDKIRRRIFSVGSISTQDLYPLYEETSNTRLRDFAKIKKLLLPISNLISVSDGLIKRSKQTKSTRSSGFRPSPR